MYIVLLVVLLRQGREIEGWYEVGCGDVNRCLWLYPERWSDQPTALDMFSLCLVVPSVSFDVLDVLGEICCCRTSPANNYKLFFPSPKFTNAVCSV